MTPERVRFRSHRFPFHVEVTQCLDPDCGCGRVTFYLDEGADGEQLPASPIQIRICVDPETWQEEDAPQRPQVDSAIVQEFLREYPAEQRAAYRTAAGRMKYTVHRLREYRIDPRDCDKGMLIAWGEIISDRARGLREPWSFFDYFKHEGTEYLLDDLYCANPDCHCREVHLMFMKYQRGDNPEDSPRVGDHFRATISLDGHLKVERSAKCTHQEASAIAAAWRAGFDDLEELEWRYEKVKEIARRSYASRATAVAPAPLPLPLGSDLAVDRPGRNDPCPCGSGKKYKKCCGR